MITLKRLPEPETLVRKKQDWLANLLKNRQTNPKYRPHSSSTYAHDDIRAVLTAMSHQKCFYCERKLDSKGEVDHYIELAEKPELAFDWGNLYLSCSACNKKLPHKSIPVQECIDPCDETINPSEHLTFDAGVIKPLRNSTKGAKTIQKYKLNEVYLTDARKNEIIRFYEILVAIQEKQLESGRAKNEFTEFEKDTLLSFAQSDHAFSLMFQVYVAKLNL